jgi:beta-1,4-mannosyl-glycoprotein beta-1,4-N-acetylglucosaminyltransferase
VRSIFALSRVLSYEKLIHKYIAASLPGWPLRPGQSAWDVEAHTRNTMTVHIRTRIADFAAGTQTLVIMSDLDEIPSRHTVDLLRTCDFGKSIHLQLRDFLYRCVLLLPMTSDSITPVRMRRRRWVFLYTPSYPPNIVLKLLYLCSFEWYLGPSSWRASAHIWNPLKSFYRHSKSGERILADSGWHCSYCFKTIPEYILKMKGFSHADRIAGRIDLLDPKRIQDTICKGKDIFGMLPEAYSVSLLRVESALCSDMLTRLHTQYLDLLSQMSLEP